MWWNFLLFQIIRIWSDSVCVTKCFSDVLYWIVFSVVYKYVVKMKLWKSLKISIGSRSDPKNYSQDLPQWGGQGYELDGEFNSTNYQISQSSNPQQPSTSILSMRCILRCKYPTFVYMDLRVQGHWRLLIIWWLVCSFISLNKKKILKSIYLQILT